MTAIHRLIEKKYYKPKSRRIRDESCERIGVNLKYYDSKVSQKSALEMKFQIRSKIIFSNTTLE
jgi:hypothetical protein